jgi:hypothetical protein
MPSSNPWLTLVAKKRCIKRSFLKLGIRSYRAIYSDAWKKVLRSRGARGLASNPRLLARFFVRKMLVGSGMIKGKMQPAIARKQAINNKCGGFHRR